MRKPYRQCRIAAVLLCFITQVTTLSELQAASGEPATVLSETDKKLWVSAIGNDRVDQLATLRNSSDLSQLLKLTASNGKSALMVACKKGDLALAKSLVAAGASIHDVTETQGTAFMFAVLGNQRHIVDWLFALGADINVLGSNGWTALTIAAAKGNEELLTWLLERGADAQVRDVYRYTPLLRAVDNGYVNTATVLLALPATDVNAQDEYDNTALHHAVASQHLPLVKLLLAHGANPDATNRQGISARDMSQGINDLEQELPLQD